jgi:serine/threonine-protein kinase
VNRGGVVLIALFTSALTATGSVYAVERWHLLRPAPPPEPVTPAMPDLRGLSEAEARGVAAASRVSLFVTSHEPSADVHPGAVLRQSVVAGQHVPSDSTVSVVIAEEVAKVPNVLATPLADAVKRLEEHGYSVQVGTAIADEKAPVDTIVRQLPKAETTYAPPGIVVVQPSAGPAQVELPKLLGMGITAAKTQVEGLGLKAVVRWVDMAETPTNVVLSQNPAAGQKVKPGSEVQLTVCSE